MSASFTDADAYDRFMGRFSRLLAGPFLDLVALAPGATVLDVGSGPGALTEALVGRGHRVSAVDPSPPFVAALSERLPGVEARVASAEALPFADATFDAALAQLVVHFMPDPAAGIAEMARVTKPGGIVAANVWAFGSGRGPLGVFSRAARDLDPSGGPDEGATAGTAEGDLERLLRRAGLVDVHGAGITVSITFDTFDDWWEPFTLGVGPAGAYVASLPPERRERLRAHARELVAEVPFTVEGTVWAATGRVTA